MSKVQNTVTAPELVPFWAILCVTVCHHVSTDTALENGDAAHLVMFQLVFVPGNINVSRLDYLVAGLTVVDDREDVPVSFF